MRSSVFEYDNYQKYLDAALSEGEGARGRKSAMARHLGCQVSYISQVLTERVHLSFEHAIEASEFLEHSEDERRCFFLLIQKGKAGSQTLKDYFQDEINDLRERRQHIRERTTTANELSQDDKSTYYSGWWFSAVHTATLIPEMKNRQDIAVFLGLSPDLVERTLDFLISRGLVREKKGKYLPGSTSVSLAPRSLTAARHHANWRLKAIEVQERLHPKNVHQSLVFAISKRDGERVRALITELLQNAEKIVNASKEERAFVLLLDFFKLSPLNK
jgi:uncharacterized protein (TIGR02147 family)